MGNLGLVAMLSRHRINTDGSGVVTLVGMYGCPLACKYCINKSMYTCNPVKISVPSLYAQLMKDELYFIYSNGGVCFGGHEPLLQSDFLKEFLEYKKSLGAVWRAGIETSLNVPQEAVQKVVDLFDYWIVDLKDTNPEIYKAYTGVEQQEVLSNLKLLINKEVKVKLPNISGYNCSDDIKVSRELLLGYGFKTSQIMEFDYLVC